MARFIPVNGHPRPEEPIDNLIRLFADNGRLVSFEKLDDSRIIISHLDTQEINSIATELANGKTIYGDAIILLDAELSGG